MSKRNQHRYQLWGWGLFIGSAIFFILASIRANDPVSLAGGTLFLVACFVFLVPLLAEVKAASSNSSRPRKYSQYRPGWSRAVNWLWRALVAPKTRPGPAHHPEQNRRHSIRSELRFFASTR